MRKLKALETDNFKPYYNHTHYESAYQLMKKQKRIDRRVIALIKYTRDQLPVYLNVKYYIDTSWEDSTNITIYLPDKEVDTTQILLSWLKGQKEMGWTIKKTWNEYSGKFMYSMTRKIGKSFTYSTYLVMFRNTADLDGCVVKERTVTRTEKYTDCATDQTL